MSETASQGRPSRSTSRRSRRSARSRSLVYVEWLDSFGCSSDWQPLDGCSAQALACKSVGWLVYDGPDCKVVVPHLTTPHANTIGRQGCGDMTIPTKAIVRIANLREPAKKAP